MRIAKRITVAFFTMVMILLMAVPAFAAGTTTRLVDMHEIAGENWEVVDSITDSYGNSYSSNVLKLDASYSAYISYDLKGNYKSFKGCVVSSTDTGSGASMNVGIFADGRLVYSATNITRQLAAKDIELDLSGVGTLEIKTSNAGEFSYGWLFLVNSSFEKAESQEVYNEWAKLSDMVAIDAGKGYEYRVELSTDVLGNLHNGSIKLDASYEDYVLYNLNAQYVTLRGTLITFPETGNGANMSVHIYADDKEVFSKSGITKQSAGQDFEIDVTGVKVLKITSSNEGEYPYGRVFLVDDILTKHIHSLGDWETTKEASCIDDGEKVQICEECGETVKIEKIPAIGHIPDGKWVIESDATCEAEGEQIQYCAVCKEICDTQKVEKLPHTPSAEWIIEREPTCDAEGFQVKKCTVCGKVSEVEAIPIMDHSYGKWEIVRGSVWNNSIVKERTCSICGDVESNSTSWLKLLVIVLFILVLGGIVVSIVILKRND